MRFSDNGHVHVSFEIPEYVANTDGVGTLRILEAIRLLGLTKKQKFIKPPLQNCMVKLKKFHRKKKPILSKKSVCRSQNVLLDYG